MSAARMVAGALALLVAGPTAAAGTQAAGWRRAAPLPLARSEVAAAVVGNQIVVAGGYVAGGQDNTARVDAFQPLRNRWRRLPDLPIRVDHAAAVGYRGGFYVVGGFDRRQDELRRAFVFRNGSWRELPRMPLPRAAAGAAVVGSRLYVAGGFGLRGELARAALVFDLERRRWSVAPGPTARDHLGVTALRGRLYAIAGEKGGPGHELRTFESYVPGDGRWSRLPPLPRRGGGLGAAAFEGAVIVGGAGDVRGPIAAVYRFDLARRIWTRLADLRTPRHSLGLVVFKGRLYAIGGGQQGFSVSAVNEFLRLS